MRLRHLPSRSIAAAALVGVLVAGCGSDDARDRPATDLPTNTSASGNAAQTTVDVGPVIGTGNIGGTVVDPRPHPIDGIDIAESYPEQLMVRFTAGDPNCTAATATATGSPDSVVVTLEVGITEDALAKSCVADEFEQVVSIPLDEGLDGREVVPAA